MFSAGVNIKSQDALKKVTLEYIYNSIKNPKPDILATITQKCYSNYAKSAMMPDYTPFFIAHS